MNMRERSREERFDEVYQIILIIVALSFDILWKTKIPIAEILVFIFALIIWAYGNLKGENVEYPFKIGSFNLLIILLTNFYSFAAFGEPVSYGLWTVIISAVTLPLICLLISYSLVRYLKVILDREITYGILIGGTLGYMISMALVLLLGS
jgi:hypothetical protein